MLTPLNGQLSPLTRASGKQPYFAKVLSLAPANLLAYYQMSEPSGSVALDSSGNGLDASYTGVTLGGANWLDGTPKPVFPGTGTNYVNLYSTGFVNGFNPREFTISLWGRVPNWTDGAERRIFHYQADGNNLIVLRKAAANNQFDLIYISAAVTRSVSMTSFNPSSFFHIAVTVSYTANKFRGFSAGVQLGSDQTVGAFVGVPTSTNVVIGARGVGGTNAWRDSVAHAAIWNAALAPADIAQLAAA